MNDIKEELIKSLGILTGFILGLILIAMIFSGCSSRKPVVVPVERIVYRTDTVHHRERIILRDTVTKTERIIESRVDSVAPILDSIGRMIGFDRWHIIDRSSTLKEENSRLLLVIDSLKTARQDSVYIEEPVPIEVVKEVNRIYWWQKLLMGAGVLALVWLCFVIWYKTKKR